MNRRVLLTAVPASALSAAIPTSAMSYADTPVMHLYRGWQAQARKIEEAPRDMPEDEFDALVEVQTEIENRMMMTPAQAIHDFVIKVVIFTDEGLFQLPGRTENPAFWREAVAIVKAREAMV